MVLTVVLLILLENLLDVLLVVSLVFDANDQMIEQELCLLLRLLLLLRLRFLFFNNMESLLLGQHFAVYILLICLLIYFQINISTFIQHFEFFNDVHRIGLSTFIVSCILLGLLLSLFFFDVVFQQPIHEISLSVSLLLGWLWIVLHRLQSLLEVVHGCVHVGAILGEVGDRLGLCR
jgi:hypothetical protein